MHRLPAAAALCGLALLTSACATSRTGDAEVRLEQGQPCYGVTAAEARDARNLQLHALTLYDTSVAPPLVVWSLSSDDSGTKLQLPAGRCVQHGEQPAGYKTIATPVLQTDRLYEVYLNATPASGRRSTHRYSARFCLSPVAGAAPRLLPLAPNASSCSAR